MCKPKLAISPTDRPPLPGRSVISLLAFGLVAAWMPGCSLPDVRSADAADTVTAAELAQVRALPARVSGQETAAGHYVLGKFYFYQGRLEKARTAFEAALRVDPGFVDAMNGLAAIHDRLGQFEAAQALYRSALQRAPQAAHVWLNFGYSLVLSGNAAQGVEPLQQALRLDPANTAARTLLAGIESPAAAAQQVASDAAEGSKVMASIAASDRPPIIASVITAGESPSAVVAAASVIELKSAKHSDAAPVSLQAARTAALAPRIWPTASAKLRVEISNGNGVGGLARSLRAELRQYGVQVARVTDARPFKRRTYIVCSPEFHAEAERLAALLPGRLPIIHASTEQRRVDMRLVLGLDSRTTWQQRSPPIKLAANDS